MNWDAVIKVVLSLLKNCREEDNESIFQRIKDPDGFLKWRFESRVRRSLGIRRAEWRESKRNEIMPEIYAKATEATEEELSDLIEEARDE